jgi:putative hemolysin
MKTEPEPANITSQLILIAVLTLVNAFFAAAEMAIVSLNKNKLKLLADEGNKKAQLLIKLTEEPTKFLSTIQVGITLAGFFSSASAATGLSDDLGQYLNSFGIPYSSQIALIVVTIILSYITLVFGELFPKRVALQKSEAIAMFAVKPILYVSKVTIPFIKLLSASTNVLVGLAGLDKEGLDEKVSKEELKSMVEVGQEHGVINETEKEMINSIFEFDDKLAYEVMTPRTDVYLIDIEKPLNEYLDELIEERYSRVPVYQDDSDNIIGILYMKDFFVEARKYGFENVDIRKILHSPYFVPETKNIDELFKELQASKMHLAVLIDEYGGFSGIVSIEDLIEEVMGEIEDEHDDEEPNVNKIDNNTFIIDGMMSIDDFNDHFHLNIESEEYDTIGGFIIYLLGRIPSNTEEKDIEYENLVLKIEEVKEKRIEKLKVYISENVKFSL